MASRCLCLVAQDTMMIAFLINIDYYFVVFLQATDIFLGVLLAVEPITPTIAFLGLLLALEPALDCFFITIAFFYSQHISFCGLYSLSLRVDMTPNIH